MYLNLFIGRIFALEGDGGRKAGLSLHPFRVSSPLSPSVVLLPYSWLLNLRLALQPLLGNFPA